MRKFINGSGADTSAAAYAFLNSHPSVIRMADLFVLKTAPNFNGHPLGKTFLLTTWDAPLTWNYRGTFTPASISSSGVVSQCGLEDQTLSVDWSPRDSDVILSGFSVLQAFNYPIFANGALEMWTVIMPTDGDCETYGACCMFAGRIGDVDANRITPQITVHSRLEHLMTKVPTITVEPGNIAAQQLPGNIPSGGPSSLTVASGSDVLTVYATGGTPAASLYNDGYLVFTSGNLGGYYARVIFSGVASGQWAFYLGGFLPFAPSAGDTCVGYSKADFEAAFPYVPVPINSAMVTS